MIFTLLQICKANVKKWFFVEFLLDDYLAQSVEQETQMNLS